MTGDLLAILTHDLRNYIAPIVNAAHLIRLKNGNDPEMSAIVSIIDRQVAAMKRTLEAVADADRLVRVRAPLRLQRVDVAEIIASAVQARRSLFDARRQGVRVSASGPVWVNGDRPRLAQAIGNVLDNAARYGEEAREIAIELEVRGDEAQVRIRDQGSGIPADVLPHVFEAFTLRPQQRTGLGLGLAVARAICELHGGRMAARSEGPGRGSEISIHLPIADPAGDRTESASSTPEPAGNATRAGSRRILIADDNQAVRNSFAAILKEMGHDVRLAADGVQAVEVAEAWSPEFVIVDVHMPKIDGYGVARKLRSRFPPDVMQLVMMSGTDLDATTLMGAKQAGFDHCVDKTLAVKGIDALIRGEAPPVHA
jgi:CheY-like chemotaxis protein